MSIEIVGTEGADFLEGTEENEDIYGLGGDDVIQGFGGDDVISGGDGDDVLAGGLGDDQLDGGLGSDIYIFDRGDGADRIVDRGDPLERNAILFGFDIFGGSVAVTQSGYDVVLTVDSDGGSITLAGLLDPSSPTRIAEVIFGDNSTWGYDEIVARSLIATEDPDTLTGDYNDNVIAGLGGDDVLRGGAGNDTIDGGTGNDRLSGNSGDDTYLFEIGSGQDVIAEGDLQGGGGYDRLELLSILPDDVTVTAEGNDLVIAIDGTSDSIRLENVIVDAAAAVEEVVFADGTIWSAAYLMYLVAPPPYHGTEGDDVYEGTNLNDDIFGEGGDDTLYGGAGMDQFHGGLGDDFLSGGAGTDYYHYAAGDGTDVIRENEGPADNGYDRLWVTGYSLWDTTVGRSADGESYILYFGGGEESITLSGAATGDLRFRVEMIHFSQGFLRGITLGSYARDVGNGDDVINGTDWMDELRGLGGNDVINGGGELDVLKGDSGADTLNGGEGDDRLDGGTGADLLVGGAGNEWYYVDDAADVIVEVEGEGDDTAYSTASSYAVGDNVETLIGISTDGQTLIGNGLDNLIKADLGDDILEGGAGNDQLFGQDGADVYRFARGDGDDQVFDYPPWVGINAVEFATGILPDDVAVTVAEGSIVLTLDNGGGSVTLNGALWNSGSYEVRFADGTVWTYQELLDRRFLGTDGADTLVGDYQANSLRGLGGDDILKGGEGDDVLEGGAGEDVLLGSYGDDSYRFERGFGHDTIFEGEDGYETNGYDRIAFLGDILPSEVTVTALADGDLLLSIAGTGDSIRIVRTLWLMDIEEVTFAGGTIWTAADLAAMAVPEIRSGDQYTGTEAGDVLQAGAGDDTLQGAGGDDSLHGESGADELVGGLGDDVLVGGAGDDVYVFAAGDGNDVIRDSDAPGDGGFDTLRITGYSSDSWDVTVALSDDGLSYILYLGGGAESITLWGAASGDPRYRIEKIVTGMWPLSGFTLADRALDVGNGDDVLTVANPYWNVLRGLAGNDVLNGGIGMDWLRGDDGDDTLIGGDGNDRLEGGAGADLLVGGAGSDTYIIDDLDTYIEAAGDEGADQIETAAASFVLPDNFENLVGRSNDSQQLTGNALDNQIWGWLGDDILQGGPGNDYMGGLSGSDVYRFARGDGDDRIIVSWDRDTLEFLYDIYPWEVTVTQSGADIVLTVDQGSGSVTLVNAPVDVVFADGTVWGQAELLARALLCTEEADTRIGYYGTDEIFGLGGDDDLNGSAGNDVIDGGDGNDLIAGGPGADVVTGGAGADIFRFGDVDLLAFDPVDRITDFAQGEDVIDLSHFDADPSDWSVNEAFTFIGTAAFSGAPGELRYEYVDGDTVIYLSSGEELVLTGLVALTASDFVL